MTMDAQLQAWLDGELPFEELPAPLRRDAEAWTGLLEDVRALGPTEAPPGAAGRVMASIRAEGRAGARPSRSRLAALAGWWVRPRPLRISPLAAAAALALVAWGAVRLASPGSPIVRDVPVAAAEGGPIYVQFLFAAPEARSVALAGDFNEWTPSIELTDPDGDGVWTGRVALRAGVHEYMFVIDGSEWLPDPNALSFTDDGFGRRNSVVAVAPIEQT